MTAQASVGFVGVGAMGRAMVERLLGASVPVAFFARRPAVVRNVAALGATPASSLGDVARQADVVVVCVFTDAQVRDVALGDEGLIAAMPPGSTLVIHTTGYPNTAVVLSANASGRGARVLDAAVSGSPDDLRAGRLTLLVGGDEEALRACRPVLAAYGDPILHVGVLGNGMRVKLVNNALFSANVHLAVEAARLAEQLGVPAAVAADAITNCSGATRALALGAAAGSPAEFESRIRRIVAKDLDVVQAVAAELGADLGLLGTVASAAVAAE